MYISNVQYRGANSLAHFCVLKCYCEWKIFLSRRRKKCASSENNKRRSLIFLKWWCLCQQMAGEKRVAPSTKVITHIKKESILNNILANVCIILCSRHHNLHSFRTKKRDSELFFSFLASLLLHSIRLLASACLLRFIYFLLSSIVHTVWSNGASEKVRKKKTFLSPQEHLN